MKRSMVDGALELLLGGYFHPPDHAQGLEHESSPRHFRWPYRTDQTQTNFWRRLLRLASAV
jgi:hypothetical protein